MNVCHATNSKKIGTGYKLIRNNYKYFERSLSSSHCFYSNNKDKAKTGSLSLNRVSVTNTWLYPTALLVWKWQLCVAADVSLTSVLTCSVCRLSSSDSSSHVALLPLLQERIRTVKQAVKIKKHFVFQKGNNLQFSNSWQMLLVVCYRQNVILLFSHLSVTHALCKTLRHIKNDSKVENVYYMYECDFLFLSEWNSGSVAQDRASKINGWWLKLPHQPPFATITVFFPKPEWRIVKRHDQVSSWSLAVFQS